MRVKEIFQATRSVVPEVSGLPGRAEADAPGSAEAVLPGTTTAVVALLPAAGPTTFPEFPVFKA